MSQILKQLGIDHTIFIQLAIFVGLYLILKAMYFGPFMKLIELRNKKTIEDGEQAQKLIKEAQNKFEEYSAVLTREKVEARKEFESIIQDTKKEEAKILAEARTEAKKITQDAMEALNQQRTELREKLKLDAESLSRLVAEKVLTG